MTQFEQEAEQIIDYHSLGTGAMALLAANGQRKDGIAINQMLQTIKKKMNKAHLSAVKEVLRRALKYNAGATSQGMAVYLEHCLKEIEEQLK